MESPKTRKAQRQQEELLVRQAATHEPASEQCRKYPNSASSACVQILAGILSGRRIAVLPYATVAGIKVQLGGDPTSTSTVDLPLLPRPLTQTISLFNCSSSLRAAQLPQILHTLPTLGSSSIAPISSNDLISRQSLLTL